VVVTAQVMKLR